MCTDCNEITIPIGPTGLTGATGPQGDPGTNGTNGANGTNGTTILTTYNNLIGIGTPNSLLETTLFTYNIPANTLSNNGDEFEIFVNLDVNSTGSTVLRVKLGSKIEQFNYATGDPDQIRSFIKIKISRISQTSQMWSIQEDVVETSVLPRIRVILIDSSTVDLSTILAFEISGQNITNSVADQILLKKATLYKYSI